MERSELLLVAGLSPLEWVLTENEKRYIYTAKVILPFGWLKGEYNVVINKAPKRLKAYVSLSHFNPTHSGYVIRDICRNAIEETPMNIAELIKIAEDDYYGSLERYVEYQNNLYARKAELEKELETINNSIKRISSRKISERNIIECDIMGNPF